jgi:hypothetical protein
MTTQNTLRWSIALLFTLGTACNKEAETDAVDTAETGDTVDTASETCAALTEGHWDMAGSAFGMSMDADLALSEDGCAFTFSGWNMNMDVPDGGTIQGDTITLSGNGRREWAACSGTAEDSSTVVGACSDGATFEMNLQ